MTMVAAVAVAVIAVGAISVLVVTDHLDGGNRGDASACCTDASINLSTGCGAITPDSPPAQRLQQQIEADPEFIAAEDGRNYTANGGFGCGFVGSPANTRLDFGFTYTSSEPYTDNCGYTWNLTYYLRVEVPLTESGYSLNAMQISHYDSSDITVTCTSST